MRKLIICLLAGVLVFQTGFSQEKRWAVVNLSVNNMREQPDYAAEMGDQCLMGTLVEIVGEDSYWKQIVAPKPYKA